MADILRKSHKLEIFAIFLAGLVFLLPRAAEVAHFATPDEYMWLTRSANFYYGLSHRDFAATFQKEHPGVTVMWAGAAALGLRFPEYKDSITHQVNPDEFHTLMSGKDVPVTLLELLRDSRLILVFVQATILLICYLYGRKLLGAWSALAAFLLVAFDPFHLGLSRLLHLDGLMSSLILFALLSFLAYLFEGRPADLIVSGLATGLSWLTKSPALFLLPVMGLLVILWTWQTRSSRERPVRTLWRFARMLLPWMGIAALAFAALWPAMWVAPLHALQQMFSMAQGFAEGGHGSALFFNGQVIPDGNLGLEYFYFYPLTYLWRTTPFVLLGLGLAAWSFIRRDDPFDKLNTRWTTIALLLTAFAYLAGMTLGDKKFDRYLLPVYPLLDIIAGLGWYGLGSFLRDKFPSRTARTAVLAGIIAVIGMQAGSALSTFPYYLTYYNPLMGGSRKAPQVMLVGWGEGLDQAARYLNKKPGVKRLKVISWYATGPFSYYFEGQDRSLWYDPGAAPEEWDRFITSDYAVIYIGQWQRQIPGPVLDYVSKLEPEHSVWIDGLEYARIYQLP